MKSFSRNILVALCAAGILSSPSSAGPTGSFSFSPVPRWSTRPLEEPETEEVCAAIRKECGNLPSVEDIQAAVTFDQLFDANGNLVGLHMTKSSGCAPLDESVLLSQRKFVFTFSKPGQSDIDQITLKLASNVNPDDVRIVRPVEHTVSWGCN